MPTKRRKTTKRTLTPVDMLAKASEILKLLEDLEPQSQYRVLNMINMIRNAVADAIDEEEDY